MKKSQSALEFLTTYGWAFLVILIMIGALAYFGVLNPQRLLPDRCTLGGGLMCEEFVWADEEIQLGIRNRMGSPVSDLAVTLRSSEYGLTFTPDEADLDATALQPDDLRIVRVEVPDGDLANAPGVGDKIRFAVSLEYTRVGGALTQSQPGELYITRR